MTNIAYTSPFVPPEWIAAHGLRPRWHQPLAAGGRSPVAPARGVCPYAGALVEAVPDGVDAAALVLTTACDQMRYAAAVLEQQGDLPVFLFNVPSTWQSAAAGRLYFDELRRLGRFLVRWGGKAPDAGSLARVMRQYDAARTEVRAARPGLSARQFAEALARVRGGGDFQGPLAASHGAAFPCEAASGCGGVPLALVGGPLPERDFALLDRIEQAGGRVVLDATEGGERTLPPPFDRRGLREEPLAELAMAYFGGIPDVFRRPNGAVHDWLARHIAERGARGVVFRRYVWCDLWHAELPRLKERCGVPVLEIDVDGDDGGTLARNLGRLESFLEMLR